MSDDILRTHSPESVGLLGDDERTPEDREFLEQNG
jgi:hypothetical protein